MEPDASALRAKLVAHLRENEVRLCDEVTRAYARSYPYSTSTGLPDEVKLAWTTAFFRGFVADVEGSVDPTRFETAGIGDMVVQREPAFAPIATFVEAELFFARSLAPEVWRRFIVEPDGATPALALLERGAQQAIRENVERFLALIERDGALQSTWNFLPMDPHAQAGTTPAPSPTRPSGARATPAATPLTARETEVLDLLVAGKTNKEIACTLGMQLSTVKNHVGHLFDKYGVSSRTQLVSLVLGHAEAPQA